MKKEQLAQMGILVSTTTRDRKHYHYDDTGLLVSLEELFDLVYSDIGWNLARVIPEVVIPVRCGAACGSQMEYFLYDEVHLGEYLFDRPSLDELFPPDAVETTARMLGVESLDGYFCDDEAEFDRRADFCDLLRIYCPKTRTMVLELRKRRMDDAWEIATLHADSNALAGMQPIIKSLIEEA